MHGESMVDVVVDYRDREFVVQEIPYSASYGYNPGHQYYANGDPGEPPSEDFQLSCQMTAEEAVEIIAEAFIADSEAGSGLGGG